ncbi:MAG: DUF4331 domain-containing protein [Actinomycetota bacterium]
MSSHREAPEISKDPVADSTDVYAFVSPDRPDSVTLIASYVPFEIPAGGPNFYEFGEEVLYQIHVSNSGDAQADITYSFRFRVDLQNPDTFLYNTGPITSLTDETFNRRQLYTVTRRDRRGRERLLGSNLPSPPCHIGPRSTPDYPALAAAAVHDLGGGRLVFAGQRADSFYVDVGAIFDLLTLRPFQAAHLIPMASSAGRNDLTNLNVHTIALQVPITDLTHGGVVPTGIDDPAAVIGVWTSASRPRARVLAGQGRRVDSGRFVQVSRLANPLFNEVVVPMGRKDEWNALEPSRDGDFLQYVQRPEVAALLPVLYPAVFPNLAALDADRADLVAVLLTGLPAGVVPGFQNFTGSPYADLMRLNVAVPPASNPSALGILGGDLAGFPNGRRLEDDVTTIELRAIAGATYPLVAPGFTPDAAALAVTQGVPPPGFLGTFPYLGHPYDGFSTPAP